MSKKNKNKKDGRKQCDTMKDVLHYIRNYRFFLVLSILCAAVSVALSLYNPILIGNAVDMVLGKGNVNFPAVFQILLKMGILIVITAVAQ